MADLKYPDDLKYAPTDEWIRVEGEEATIGISDYAQDALNDIVYVELPDVGAVLEAGKAFGVVESVKAAGDLLMPLSGEVIAVNNALEESPEAINADPYGTGWILKIKVTDDSNLANLMDSAAYQAHNAQRDS